MPRPTTKLELAELANKKFQEVFALIKAMPIEEQEASFSFGDDIKQKEAHWKRDKNLRDILIHLYEWHQLLLRWIESNQNGVSKPFLPEPYTWRTYGDMNIELWKQHQSTSYVEAESLLKNSHSKAKELLGAFNDEELFAKKHFSWTGTTFLGSYFVSSTSSHYEWAIKKIKAHRKSYAKKKQPKEWEQQSLLVSKLAAADLVEAANGLPMAAAMV